MRFFPVRNGVRRMKREEFAARSMGAPARRDMSQIALQGTGVNEKEARERRAGEHGRFIGQRRKDFHTDPLAVRESLLYRARQKRMRTHNLNRQSHDLATKMLSGLLGSNLRWNET